MDKAAIKTHKTNVSIFRDNAFQEIEDLKENLESFESDYLTYEDWTGIREGLRKLNLEYGQKIKSLKMLKLDLRKEANHA